MTKGYDYGSLRPCAGTSDFETRGDERKNSKFIVSGSTNYSTDRLVYSLIPTRFFRLLATGY